MKPKHPWILLALALWLACNAAALAYLRARPGLLVLYRTSRHGVSFESAPDARMRAPLGRSTIDYSIPQLAQSPTRHLLPQATGADSGLADVRAAIRWVRGELRIGDSGSMPAPWRMRTLLAKARDSSNTFLCDTYARALVWALQNMGYPARVVIVEAPNGSALWLRHTTSSVYLPSLGQWVLADATYDFIARAPDGRPLSLIDVSRTLRGGGRVVYERVVGRKDDDEAMDQERQYMLEPSLAGANFVVLDGGTWFGTTGPLARLVRFLAGRPAGIQLALDGQPPRDAPLRRFRALLLQLNGIALAACAVALVRRWLAH